MLLLETLPVHSLAAPFLPYLFSAAALLLTVIALFRKESREDGQTMPQRLKKLEVDIANQLARQQGFQAEIEAVADYGKRERQTIIDNARRDHETLKDLIKDVPNMRDLLSRMDERFTSTKDEMKSLAAKMDRIVELLTHK